MTEQNKVEEFLFTSCEKVKRKSGMGYVLRCPVCGDSKKNPNKRRCHVDYYAQYDEWIYTCYNGGCPEPTGNIQSLYANVKGISWKEADRELNDKEYDASKAKQRLKNTNKFVEQEDEETSNGVLDLDLNECFDVNDKPEGRIHKKMVQKLIDFKKDRLIEHVQCFIAHKGKYKGRLILPVYINDEMVYFQGRTAFDEIEPKYLNPDVKKDSIILNSDKFDKEKYIIVTEGLIDAYMVEHNQGTSCIGASISDDLLSSLVKMTNKGVIVALDNPITDESGIKNYIKLLEDSKYGKNLRYFFMPYDDIKDLNQLKKEKNIPNIYDFVLENSYSHFKSSILIKNLSS